MTALRTPDDLLLIGSVQTRQSLHITDVDDVKGEVYGRCVPYEQEVELLPGLVESFARGAFGSQPSARDHWARVQLRWAHATDEVPLGKAVQLEEKTDGLYGRYAFNQILRQQPGTRAWEVWESLAAGDMEDLSVGFRVKKEPTLTVQDEIVHLHRGKDSSYLIEVSVVPSGAYGSLAKVSAMRDTRQLWRDEWAARIERLRYDRD